MLGPFRDLCSIRRDRHGCPHHRAAGTEQDEQISIRRNHFQAKINKNFLPERIVHGTNFANPLGGAGDHRSRIWLQSCSLCRIPDPLHIYLANKEGVFRYIPDGHKIVQVMEGDVRASLTRAALGQSDISEAPVDIIIAANFAITQAKYGARAFRYVCMEVGHVAENIVLQSVALGLGSVTIGAFWDDVIKKDLNLPDNEEPLYIIPIGYEKYEQQ